MKVTVTYEFEEADGLMKLYNSAQHSIDNVYQNISKEGKLFEWENACWNRNELPYGSWEIRLEGKLNPATAAGAAPDPATVDQKKQLNEQSSYRRS